MTRYKVEEIGKTEIEELRLSFANQIFALWDRIQELEKKLIKKISSYDCPLSKNLNHDYHSCSICGDK